MEFLQTNQMFIVLGIVLLIWFGIIGYLIRLEKRIQEIEKSKTR
jgi:hypothetical protein